MTTRAHINGTNIHYEMQGDGPPLVLVHGSWGDAVEWEAVTGPLAENFRVIAYDRRGHSRSDQGHGADTRRTDEDDLVAIIESLADGSAHIAANSFGGLIALGVTARRPEIVRSVSVHEPPAAPLLPAEVAGELMAAVGEIVEGIAAGEVEIATRRFMEEIALGPGSWELLTDHERATFIGNAPTFLGEMADPAALEVDLAALGSNGVTTQVSKGSESPPPLVMLADALAAALPHAETGVVEGAGHNPHETHPHGYVEMIAAFAGHAERLTV